MATLILTAVGTVVGGPIGGAIGAIAGQAIDSAIFAPKARQGPRLGDLKVQTSTYGAAIPKLFGRTRVAGTVIWATDLIETRASQSNGKGRPRTETYSYAASFAVALSARPILGVERIWADGKLLRGAAGDLKSATGFRLHLGSEGQALDPLIASAQGIGTTPAYRGVAYAVFDAMALGEFGNRIPSLSFEVIADPEPRGAGSIIAELAGEGVTSDGGPALLGLAAGGDNVRGVAETLGAALPFAVIEGRALRYGAGPVVSFDADDLGTGGVARVALDREPGSQAAEALVLSYIELARDYQEGAQRAAGGGGKRRTMRLELPAVLEAGTAKGFAEARLRGLDAERTRARIALPWRAMTIAPGDRLALPEVAGQFRVERARFEAMAVKLDLVRVAAVPGAVAADAGAAVAEADRVHGPTTLAIADLPQLGDAPVDAPMLAIAANGASGGWRRAALLASSDGRATYAALGTTALPATIGTVAGVLAAGPAGLVDHINSIDVALIHNGLTLEDADEAQLLAGANRAIIGDEMLQYGRATPLGGASWRLSALWRGRRGTEWAIGGHAPGERFVLLDAAALFIVPNERAIGALRVLAAGIGDGSASAKTGPAEIGRAGRPLSPARLRAEALGADIELHWIRRSRDGWAWRDSIDAPLAEEREAYRVTRTTDLGLTETHETTEPRWTYTAAMRAADLAGGAATMSITVSQIGTRGVSHPASIMLTL